MLLEVYAKETIDVRTLQGDFYHLLWNSTTFTR